MLLPAGAIDWAEWGSTQQEQSRASCYGCHSGASKRTWNNRDVKVEFARASHHPIVAETPDALPVASTVTVLEQTTRAEFSSLGLLAFGDTAVEDVADAVRLADDSWPEEYPVKNLLFAAGTQYTTMSQYDPGAGAWNSMGYTPPSHTYTTTNSDALFAAEGKLYYLLDNGLMEIYTPADGVTTGSWEVKSGVVHYGNGGADAAVDVANRYVYEVQANGWGGAVNRLDLRDDSWLGSAFTLPFNLGVGAAADYSPTTDQFFVVNRYRNWAGDGQLYAVASPSTTSGPVTPRATGITLSFSATGQMGQTRMVCVTRGGKDYLLVFGGVAYARTDLRVVSGLGPTETPTLRSTGKYPYTGNDYYPTLAWDGGDYLYASQSAGLRRILIPADPANGEWGEWEELPTPPNGQSYGWGIAFQQARGFPITDTGYKSVGTVTAPLTAPDGATAWGEITWSVSTPASTSVSVTIQRANGTGWADVPGFVNMTSGSADLGAISPVTYPRLRAVARLATENKHATPQLRAWRVTARKARPVHRDQVLVPEVAFSATAPTATIDTAKAFEATLAVATLPEVMTYTPVPDRRLMYVTETSNGEVLQFDTSATAWNTYAFDPVDYTPTGSVNEQPASVAHNGYVYTMRPSGAAFPSPIPYVSLQTGPDKVPQLMGAAPTYDTGGGRGMDAAVDPSWGFVYVSRGGGDTGRIDVYYMGAGTLYPQASLRVLDPATGTALGTGELSSIAYVPSPIDKLFIVNRNGGAGNGRLYSVANVSQMVEFGGWPGTYSVTAVDTSATVSPVVGETHITRVNRGGTDYLVAFGRVNWGNQVSVVSNLGNTTQTVTVKHQTNFPVGGYVQLEWDVSDSVYTQGGSWAANFYRSVVPTDPVTDAWPATAWDNGTYPPTPLPAAPRTRSVASTKHTYTSLAFAVSPVRGIPVPTYPTSTSTTYSPEVLPATGASQWGAVRWSGTDEAGATTVTVAVEGNQSASGGTWEPLIAATRDRAIDLGGRSTTVYKRLRLKGVLQSNTVLKTPRLTNWSVWCGAGTGRWTSSAIHPDASDTNWGSAAFVASHAPGSLLKLTVQRSDLAVTWTDVPGFVGVPLAGLPISLGTLTTTAHPYIRIVVDYVPGNGQLLGTLEQATVTSAHLEDRPIGAMTCANCHNVHNVAGAPTGAWDPGRVSDPQNTRVRSTDVTSTVSGFCLRCHNTKIVRKSATVSSLVPYDLLFSEQPDRWFFTGWDKDSPGFSPYQSAHFTTSGARAYCETCHDPHGSDNEHLTAWTRPASWTTGTAGVRDNSTGAAFEERLCLQCHGNGTVGKQAPGAPNVATPLSGSNSHPVRTVGGVHGDTETTATLGGANRHAECVDCHDPHSARPGVHQVGSAAAGGALYGVVGIQPEWGTAPWTAATGYQPHRLQDTPRDPESYLCFKCHTDVVSRPTTGTSGTAYSDLTVAFNPNNMSYHNVLGLPVGAQTSFSDGVTTYAWPWRGAFKVGWTKDSGVTCTGCHTSEAIGSARGPHGSSTDYMLDSNWSLDFRNAEFELYVDVVRTTDPKLICNKCHDFANSGNTAHHPVSSVKEVAHSGRACSYCHIAIPHGWKRPRLLAYTTDPAPYAAKAGGLIAVAKNGGLRWDFTDCKAGCYGNNYGTHDITMTVPTWD
jgi:hypothetical protein